jgi:hypothetical protein
MRWEALFADLEAEAQADADAERRSEVAERVRTELARLRLIDRLQPLLGRAEVRPRFGLVNGETLSGSVRGLGADWVLLAEESGEPGEVGDAEWLVPLGVVQWIEGLTAGSAEPGWEGKVGARLGLRIPLRRIVRDRSNVALTLLSGQLLRGRLERVSADHVVLEPTDASTRPSVGVTIPLTAIVCLRRG